MKNRCDKYTQIDFVLSPVDYRKENTGTHKNNQKQHCLCKGKKGGNFLEKGKERAHIFQKNIQGEQT